MKPMLDIYEEIRISNNIDVAVSEIDLKPNEEFEKEWSKPPKRIKGFKVK